MKWLRLYNAAANDPNWRVIADETGQPVHAVMAVWFVMLCHASAADPRGTLTGWIDRRAGAMTGLPGAVILSIREAMQGVTLNGDTLLNWDQEQYESDSSAARTREYRERKKHRPATVTPPSHDDAGSSHGGDVTSRDDDVTSPPLRATDNRLQNKELPLRGETTRERVRADDADFEAFWSAYPRKVGKGAARKAFQAAAHKVPLSQMLEAVQRYQRFLKQPGAPHCCHPTTWLHQERWTDELNETPHDQRGNASQQRYIRRGAAALAAEIEQELAVGADDRQRDRGNDFWDQAGGITLEGSYRRLSGYDA